MHHQTQSSGPYYTSVWHAAPSAESAISCNWKHFRGQMLLQWKRLSIQDLEEAGPWREVIAQLIERKYGIAASLVENYLRNFEQTMIASHAAQNRQG